MAIPYPDPRAKSLRAGRRQRRTSACDRADGLVSAPTRLDQHPGVDLRDVAALDADDRHAENSTPRESSIDEREALELVNALAVASLRIIDDDLQRITVDEMDRVEILVGPGLA